MTLTATALVAFGCGGGGSNAKPDAADPTPDAAVMAAVVVGETGGTVMTPGGEAELEVPPGAVDSDTMITIAASTDAAPDGALGTVYTFGPAGLVFAHPITITLALPAGVTSGDVYWSRPGGQPGFDDIGGTITGDKITTQIVHFSEGFVGAAETSRTVTGSQSVGWVSASTFQLVPNDLSAFQVGALVDDGAGGYTTIQGTGYNDGTFTIPNVPDGPYWLRVPAQFGGVAYYRTSANAVDAGYTSQGRPDATVTPANTKLQVNATNLATWQDTDELELFSTESYAWYFRANQYMTLAGGPATGDMSLTNWTVDMTVDYAGTPHLVEGNHVPPDRLVVAQLASRTTSSNVPYVAMTRVLEPAPFTMVGGQTTSLSGAFTDVTTSNTIALDVRLDNIRASLDEETRPCTVPASWPYGYGVYVLGIPGGTDHSISGATADFMLLDLAYSAPDTAGTDFDYGVPLQGTWGVYGEARFNKPCDYQLAGTTEAATVFGASGLAIVESLPQISAGALGVRLSQPRTPTIAGNDFYASNAGFGLTPTIAWTAPAIGTPTFYEVAVYHLYVSGTATLQEHVARFTTDALSLKLPPGVLQTGESYVFQIIARNSARTDASAFNREALPEYSASVISGIQTL